MFMPTDSAAEIEPVAIVFDADGTLLDSLPPHVAFCRAMNDKYACGLSLPDLSSSAGMEPQLHPQPQDSHDDAAHADPHADRGYDHNPDPAVAAGSLAAARALAAAPMDNFLRRAGFAEALVPAHSCSPRKKAPPLNGRAGGALGGAARCAPPCGRRHT